MPSKHEWSRDWFGSRRPPRPEDLEEAPSGPPPTYAVQLFYEREPRLDKETVLARLRTNCGTVELKESSESLLMFDLQDFKGRMWESDVPYKCSISTRAPALPMEDLETSLAQTHDWREARSVLATCKTMAIVSDLLANWHDYRVRLVVFQKVVRSLLEISRCAAIHWIPSLRVLQPEAFLRRQQPGELHDVLFGAVNIRAFRVEGGAPEEMVMDTMGLATLGLPDVQCHAHGWNLDYVADAVYNIAGLIFETGEVPQEGEVFETARFPGLLCRPAWAMIPPQRPVVNIEPSEQLAANWLPQTRTTPTTPKGGKNIFHGERQAPSTNVGAATREGYERQREDIYQSLFGPFQEVHDDRAGVVPAIKVYVFPPYPGGRNFYTLITGGMSDLSMKVPPDAPPAVPTHLELVFYAQEPKQEYIDFLRTTAHFPHDYATCLGWGHTIPNGQPPSPIFAGSKLTGLVLVQTPIMPDDTLRDKLVLDGNPVELLWVVPLTSAELLHKREHGTEGLLKVFDEVQHPFVFDEKRDCYVTEPASHGAAPGQHVTHAISYLRVEHGVFYHGTASDLDGLVKSTWSFEEGGRRITRDQPIAKDAFLFLCNGIAEFAVFRRCVVRNVDASMDPVNYHCVMFEKGGQQTGFMIPAGEADRDFARWLEALRVPKSADAPGGAAPKPAAEKSGEPKKPWYKFW